MFYNYNDKKFRSIENSASGEVGTETIFDYHQDGDLVWAEYRGGEIVYGTLIARCGIRGTLDAVPAYESNRGTYDGHMFFKSRGPA